MTEADAGTPGFATGFRLDQLKEAFERVCDPRDWTAPIRAVIPAVDRLLVEKAVRWYAETEPRFEEVPGDEMLLTVVAPGYRGSWDGESPDSTHSIENGKTR
jgi:hypothetical protein